MFGKKLVLIAAAVALTMSHVAAVDEASHVKVQVSKSGVKHNVVKHHAAKHHAVKHHSKPVVKHAKHAKKAHVKQSDDESGSGDDDDDEKITIEIEIDYSDPEKYCSEGWSPMSVEGIEGIFCVSGQACVDDIDGSCPVPQQGLEFGAYCGEVKTGVMGCKPMTEEMWWQTQGGDDNGNNSGPVCGDGFSPMSVEGVEGVFCVEGQACVADIDGACPGPQDDLEYGSYCGTVKTGVKGCKPYTEDQTPEPTAEPTETDDTCEEGSTPMSVEGVEGIFCVEGQACAGVNGTCPDAQDGLEFGSYCGKVKTGVLGCKPYADETQTPEEDDGTEVIVEVCDDGWSPMSVEGVEGVFCVEGQACAGVNGTCPEAQDGLEFGSYCGKVSSGVLGCKPYADDSHTPDEDDEPTEEPTETDDTCDEGSSPMSVEGVEGVFCVEGQACAGVEGSCPGPQDGLEFGSYCGKVASGVLGCKPNTEAPPPADDDEFCSGEGESPMSVEGVEGVFCVSGQACAGVQGACPGPQDGLEFGSYCGNVASGVLGCKPNTSKKMMKHHKVTHPAKKHHKKAHGAATAKKNTEAHAKTHANKKVHAKVTHAKKPRTVVKKVHANKH